MIEKPPNGNIPQADVRELVKESQKRMAAAGLSGPLKQSCLTCNRHLDELDLLLGYCPYCMEERARNLLEQFRPMGTDGTRRAFPQCYECHRDIITHGLKTWDTLAKSFKLVCIDCGYKQVEKDRQYRDTDWGYARGLR